MHGTIDALIKDRFFGYVRGKDGGRYFFHKSDFNGHWNDLVLDFVTSKNGPLPVEFEIVQPEPVKGPRAREVRRLDWPNQ